MGWLEGLNASSSSQHCTRMPLRGGGSVAVYTCKCAVGLLGLWYCDEVWDLSLRKKEVGGPNRAGCSQPCFETPSLNSCSTCGRVWALPSRPARSACPEKVPLEAGHAPTPVTKRAPLLPKGAPYSYTSADTTKELPFLAQPWLRLVTPHAALHVLTTLFRCPHTIAKKLKPSPLLSGHSDALAQAQPWPSTHTWSAN